MKRFEITPVTLTGSLYRIHVVI